MCKSRITNIDLQSDSTGSINVNMTQLAPNLVGKPIKITVKTVSSMMGTTATDNISGNVSLRICHNISTKNAGNMIGANSNVLCFFDLFSVRSHALNVLFSTFNPDTHLFCPVGMPSQLSLVRTWYTATNSNTTSDATNGAYTGLIFNVRLEIEELDLDDS